MENILTCLKCKSNNNEECFRCSKLSLNKKGVVSLPQKSVFFHMNHQILYDKPENYDYSEKSILLVGCGSIKRTSVLESLKQLGFKRIVCLARARLNWAEVFFDDWILAEHEDLFFKELTLSAVEAYMSKKNFKFDAILTFDDYSVLVNSYIISQLKGYIGIPYEFVEKIKNKYQFRTLCRELGINCPNFFLIESNERKNFCNKLADNPEVILKDDRPWNLPIIVKNALGSGKDFVKKCSSVSELKECIEDSLKFHMDLLVEEFYDGIELDIDILIQNNQVKFISVSDNFPPLMPSFHEQGGICPSVKLSSHEIEFVETLITKWLSKMVFQDGVLHFEAKFNPNLLYELNDQSCLMPIEINSRLGGCETWSNVKASFGVDLIREHANICLGYELNLTSKKKAHSRCISRNFLAKNVFFESLEINVDKLKASDCVELCVFKSVGEKLKNNENVGWICAKGDHETSEIQFINKLEKILNYVKIGFSESSFIEIEQ